MQRQRINIREDIVVSIPVLILLFLGIIFTTFPSIEISSVGNLYSEKSGTVLYTLTNFANSDNGYDSVVAFQYYNDNDDKICFLNTCTGCETYQAANLSSYSYKIGFNETIFIDNKITTKCYLNNKVVKVEVIFPIIISIGCIFVLFALYMTYKVIEGKIFSMSTSETTQNVINNDVV